MTTRDDLDRQLDAFLRDGPIDLPDSSFYAVRDRIDQTGQRVVFGPWRMPNVMNKFAALGLGAAAVVVALVLGMQFLPSTPSGVGGAPAASPSPSPTPTAAPPSPSAASRATPSPITPPPLTGSFTSPLHGYSMSYPEGWTTRAATAPWTDDTFALEFGGLHADFMYDPVQEANLFLTVASQPIRQSSPAEWTAQQMASGEGCGATTQPIAVGGASGVIGPEGCDVAVVTTGGRGYWIQLYTSADDPVAVAPYDRSWFESVLATVKLRPEDAVDTAPSASPS